jgi:cell filamentation protein
LTIRLLRSPRRHDPPCGRSPDLGQLCAIHLHGESLLRGLPRDVFTERLTYDLGEVNAVHPFREGNGRAQRAFSGQLASDAGFILDWQHLDADRNVAASVAIMHGDPAPMRTMLDELLRQA